MLCRVDREGSGKLTGAEGNREKDVRTFQEHSRLSGGGQNTEVWLRCEGRTKDVLMDRCGM